MNDTSYNETYTTNGAIDTASLTKPKFDIVPFKIARALNNFAKALIIDKDGLKIDLRDLADDKFRGLVVETLKKEIGNHINSDDSRQNLADLLFTFDQIISTSLRFDFEERRFGELLIANRLSHYALKGYIDIVENFDEMLKESIVLFEQLTEDNMQNIGSHLNIVIDEILENTNHTTAINLSRKASIISFNIGRHHELYHHLSYYKDAFLKCIDINANAHGLYDSYCTSVRATLASNLWHWLFIAVSQEDNAKEQFLSYGISTDKNVILSDEFFSIFLEEIGYRPLNSEDIVSQDDAQETLGNNEAESPSMVALDPSGDALIEQSINISQTEA